MTIVPSRDTLVPTHGSTALLALVLSAFVALPTFAARNAAKPRVIRIGHHLSASHSVQQGLLEFSRQIDARLPHKFTVRIYPAEQLGSERQLLEGTMLGSIDLAPVSANIVQSIEPSAGLTALPFLFRDFAHAFRAEDGAVGAEITKRVNARTGTVCLGFFSTGFRIVATRSRNLMRASDLQGLRIRVPESRMHVATFRELGANPTPVPWGEVYTALLLKLVDGAESPPAVLASAHLVEVAPYLTTTRHMYADMLLLVSADLWRSLSERDRTAFREAARKAVAHQRRLAVAEHDSALALMREQGATIAEIDTRDLKNAAAPVYATLEQQIGGRALIDAALTGP